MTVEEAIRQRAEVILSLFPNVTEKEARNIASKEWYDTDKRVSRYSEETRRAVAKHYHPAGKGE